MKLITLKAAFLACAIAGAAHFSAANAAENCDRYDAMQFVCGPTGAEDIVRVAGTRWLVASGLAEPQVPGRLHLIDSVSKQWEVAYPASDVKLAADRRRFPQCTTPPDAATFSAHGLAIKRTGHSKHSLLVVNHGREAIEFFEVESRGTKPQLTWVGCVPMPSDVYLNSVAPLPDGGFVTTQFYTPSKGGMAAILAGSLTGGVLEWHPGKAVTSIPGTDLSGANGIEVASGGRVLYVNAWGSKDIVRFDRRGAALKKDVVRVDFSPDNLRWAANGKQLLVAGQRFKTGGASPLEMEGWRVALLTPETLAVSPVFSADDKNPIQGVSVALEVDGLLWVGPFRGDRVGYLTMPR
jgi:hypothetical protein